ncbi:hypothetical protein PsorP6_000834 [Peronosclerospora sorghi]|uniref:Uncharacterized protein n=1 Tax=Peronosclerospora sorghi TaxID=230839 RepID=A0ACC0WVH5_9STRA|nr:hypothetical protein PsorP6_000834 [Peronosclerospora sorghi]
MPSFFSLRTNSSDDTPRIIGGPFSTLALLPLQQPGTSILDISLVTTTSHWNFDLYRLELRLRVVQITLAGGCYVHDTANFALKPHLKSENYVSANH